MIVGVLMEMASLVKGSRWEETSVVVVACCEGGVVDARATHGAGGVVGAALGAVEVVGAA
jgi:hypothetical protein